MSPLAQKQLIHSVQRQVQRARRNGVAWKALADESGLPLATLKRLFHGLMRYNPRSVALMAAWHGPNFEDILVGAFKAGHSIAQVAQTYHVSPRKVEARLRKAL